MILFSEHVTWRAAAPPGMKRADCDLLGCAHAVPSVAGRVGRGVPNPLQHVGPDLLVAPPLVAPCREARIPDSGEEEVPLDRRHEDATMEVVYERCCGLDVHKATVVACLLTLVGRPADKVVRTFGTVTDELLALATVVAAAGAPTSRWRAPGSTGSRSGTCWRTSSTLLLVNARHIKEVPGRKTDTIVVPSQRRSATRDQLQELEAPGVVSKARVEDDGRGVGSRSMAPPRCRRGSGSGTGTDTTGRTRYAVRPLRNRSSGHGAAGRLVQVCHGRRQPRAVGVAEVLELVRTRHSRCAGSRIRPRRRRSQRRPAPVERAFLDAVLDRDVRVERAPSPRRCEHEQQDRDDERELDEDWPRDPCSTKSAGRARTQIAGPVGSGG